MMIIDISSNQSRSSLLLFILNTLVILRRYELCFEIWMDTNNNNKKKKK